MKQKTIIARRERRKVNPNAYSKKIKQQKQGKFNSNSPFIPADFIGIPLSELNKRRFKKTSYRFNL